MTCELAFCLCWFWLGTSACSWSFLYGNNNENWEGREEKNKATIRNWFWDEVLYLSKYIIKNNSIIEKKQNT